MRRCWHANECQTVGAQRFPRLEVAMAELRINSSSMSSVSSSSSSSTENSLLSPSFLDSHAPHVKVQDRPSDAEILTRSTSHCGCMTCIPRFVSRVRVIDLRLPRSDMEPASKTSVFPASNLSLLVLDLASSIAPDEPLVPDISIEILASVPAFLAVPVVTDTWYVTLSRLDARLDFSRAAATSDVALARLSVVREPRGLAFAREDAVDDCDNRRSAPGDAARELERDELRDDVTEDDVRGTLPDGTARLVAREVLARVGVAVRSGNSCTNPFSLLSHAPLQSKKYCFPAGSSMVTEATCQLGLNSFSPFLLSDCSLIFFSTPRLEMLVSSNTSVLPLSNLSLFVDDFNNGLAPLSPLSPNIVSRMLASVEAPLSVPVTTVTVYVPRAIASSDTAVSCSLTCMSSFSADFDDSGASTSDFSLIQSLT
eukprot:m.627088 g.627088  ORF g.627088 m.627088 type:complete len:427 (+) comp22554_c0_seq2:122-1402(+)